MSSTNPAASVNIQSAATQNQKLLEALIKQIPDKGLDWQKIADDLGSTVGAARERWRRYKIANGIVTSASNAANAKESTTGSSKKARTPKRTADASEGDDVGEGTPSKKKTTPAKKKVKTVKSDVKVAEESGSEEEVEVEVKTPLKKVAAKKLATPKKAATPKTKVKDAAKEEIEAEAEEESAAEVEEEKKIEADDDESKDIAALKEEDKMDAEA